MVERMLAAVATPIPQATTAQASILAAVPLKVFGVGFLVILGLFLAWYMYARSR